MCGESLPRGTSGTVALRLDLDALPQPLGATRVLPGDTWHFQAWYRDANPSLTSNFSDPLRIAFF